MLYVSWRTKKWVASCCSRLLIEELHAERPCGQTIHFVQGWWNENQKLILHFLGTTIANVLCLCQHCQKEDHHVVESSSLHQHLWAGLNVGIKHKMFWVLTCVFEGTLQVSCSHSTLISYEIDLILRNHWRILLCFLYGWTVFVLKLYFSLFIIVASVH